MPNQFIPSVTPPANQTNPALWFAFAGDKLLYQEDSPQVVPNLIDFAQLGLPTVRQQYLGTLNGQHCYSVELAEPVSAPEGMVLAGLRQAYIHLGEELFTVAGRAVQVVDWDRTHQFCGRCGAKTVDHPTDRAKKCPECGLSNVKQMLNCSTTVV